MHQPAASTRQGARAPLLSNVLSSSQSTLRSSCRRILFVFPLGRFSIVACVFLLFCFLIFFPTYGTTFRREEEQMECGYQMGRGPPSSAVATLQERCRAPPLLGPRRTASSSVAPTTAAADTNSIAAPLPSPPSPSRRRRYVMTRMMMPRLRLLLLLLFAEAETVAQRQALLDFYDNTKPWAASCSEQWSSLSTTTSTTTMTTFCNHNVGPFFSTFYGVTCSSASGDVLALNLRGCRINGTLPAAFSALTSLEGLFLEENQLHSTLPAEWGPALAALRQLALVKNDLSGTVPASWAKMSSMNRLSLNGNQLSGTLPPEWGTGMPQMTRISVDSNQMIGTLPPEWSTWKFVMGIYVSTNSFVGTLPPEWAALTSLQELDVYSNRLEGSLPAAWGANLSQLRSLNAQNNQLQGELPSEWSTGMTSLQTLHLQLNRLSGTLPSSWGRFSSLKNLQLFSNAFHGTLPSEWSTMSALEFLAVSGSKGITGALPAAWAGMTKLRQLSLYNNNLTGTLPVAWRAMVLLEALILQQNQLSGSLPPEWSAMTNLQTVQLFENELTGTLPPQWGLLGALQTLSVQMNRFSGTLPAAWFGLTNLTTLVAYRNQLSGALPEEWGSSRSRLITVNFDRNQLSSTLPASWSAMPFLSSLSLAQNRLVGTLPADWGALASIETLSLSNNQLSGTLPVEWQRMNTLQRLGLAINRFYGTVPSEWPLGMSKISPNSSNCHWTCRGTVGIDATCIEQGPPYQFQCPAIEVMYNCLNTTAELPPAALGSTWKWMESMLTPQQQSTMCGDDVPITATATVTSQDTSEMSSSASSSMATKEWNETVSMHHSATISVDRSLSVSLPLVPAAAASVEVGLETTVDAALTLTVAGPLAAVATGLTGAANVQRAMLAMSLAVQCHSDDGEGGSGERRGRDAVLSASLPRSHSPLGLEGSGCALSQHCGAVLGNLLLLLITAVLAFGVVWFKRRQQQQQKLAFHHHQQHQSDSDAVVEAVVPYRAVLAAVGLPGRVVPIAVLLLQPTVSSCLTLLWYSSSGGEGASGAWMGYFVALLGLGTYSALACLLRRLLASEMNTLQVVYAPPPRPRRGGRSPSLVVASAAWWFTTWVRYEPLACLAPRKKATAREFCAMWGGSLFQKYRRGCGDWFYAVGLWLSAAAGLLGSVIPETQAGCDAAQAFFILLSIAALGSVVIWRPFASTPLQLLTVTQEAAGLATACCVAAGSVKGVEVAARLQIALSCVGTLLMVGRLVYARRGGPSYRAATDNGSSSGDGGAPSEQEAARGPLSLSSLSVASRDELSYLLHITNYPSQCIRQSEERLRMLITFVCKEEQQKRTTHMMQQQQQQQQSRQRTSEALDRGPPSQQQQKEQRQELL